MASGRSEAAPAKERLQSALRHACICNSEQLFQSMMADPPAACLCPMRGNPRRFGELTVQGRRHLPKFDDVE
jgi:hypothetical protein